MPQFYFDVSVGNDLISDDEGVQLESLDIAESKAVRAASEISHNSLPKRRISEVAVQVRDQDGEPVLSVAVSMSIHRKEHGIAKASTLPS